MTPLPPIAPIAPMDGLASMPLGPIGDEVAPVAAAGGFSGILTNAVSGLNDQLVGSERLTEQAATGGLVDPTVALVAVEKADLAFTTAVQVRNKLIEGWQEISRMQV